MGRNVALMAFIWCLLFIDVHENKRTYIVSQRSSEETQLLRLGI